MFSTSLYESNLNPRIESKAGVSKRTEVYFFLSQARPFGDIVLRIPTSRKMWIRHHEEERDGQCQGTAMNLYSYITHKFTVIIMLYIYMYIALTAFFCLPTVQFIAQQHACGIYDCPSDERNNNIFLSLTPSRTSKLKASMHL